MTDFLYRKKPLPRPMTHYNWPIVIKCHEGSLAAALPQVPGWDCPTLMRNERASLFHISLTPSQHPFFEPPASLNDSEPYGRQGSES